MIFPHPLIYDNIIIQLESTFILCKITMSKSAAKTDLNEASATKSDPV